MKRHHHLKVGMVVAATAVLLSACNRPGGEERTAGQRVDDTIAKTEQQADKAKAATEAAVDKMESKVEDAAITASVNAALAKDAKLSAVRINVDTVNGHVALRGTAPDASARERATQLAMSVKGVMSVDNQLEVRA
ncbi:MAG TPA: BON domain-containing protein [Roseateles sp.]|nr:BON domain-containing protein [Roseateles sp.]